MKSFISIICLVFLSSGCATWNKWFGGDSEAEATANSSISKGKSPMMEANTGAISNNGSSGEDLVRFSENPNIGTFNERRYKRATRKSIEEDNDVGSRAGSLWNTEGPSSYLFTQNKLHREGDLLNIKLEGNAKTQMETKIQVIKKLLARLEIVPTPGIESPPNNSPLASQGAAGDGRGPASSPSNTSSGVSGDKNASASNNGSVGNGNSKDGNSKNLVSSGSNIKSNALNPSSSENSNSELDTPVQVESVPTRVAERMADGNYRVKGQQSFMIGKKEFRVIITGLVRPEDFTDEGMSSNKLLDPQLDIVSLRRNL